MKAKQIALAALLASAGSAAVALAFERSEAAPQQLSPAQVAQSRVRLLYAQPYVLDKAYEHAWRSDRPATSAGYIVAVAADAEVLPPMQVHHPLLFVGDMPVERINDGSQSGVYLGFVPSASGPDGLPTLDLAQEPIYWSKPEILPEALTVDDARRVLAGALASGTTAQPAAVVAAALAEGGGAVYLESEGMLRRYAADLIERYSPDEADLISGLRAPLLNK